MIDQHDTQLQRIFDERLMRVLPPPRTPRRRGRPGRVLAAVLAVLLAGTSLALVADVNRTAEIRKRVLNTQDLSVNARNVKIMTSQGHVFTAAFDLVALRGL